MRLSTDCRLLLNANRVRTATTARVPNAQSIEYLQIQDFTKSTPTEKEIILQFDLLGNKSDYVLGLTIKWNEMR